MNKLAKLIFAASAVVAFSASAQGTADIQAKTANSAYVQDARGVIARNPFGLCWRTGYWTPADAVPGCDGSAGQGAKARTPLRPPCRRRPLRPAPAPAPVPTSEKVSFAADAFFDFDKAVLKPDGKAKLDDLASKLQGHEPGSHHRRRPHRLDRYRCLQPEAVGAPRRSRQGLPGVQGRRSQPHLHRRQGREAAGRRQQDRALAAPRTVAWKSKSSVPAPSNRSGCCTAKPRFGGVFLCAASLRAMRHSPMDQAKLCAFPLLFRHERRPSTNSRNSANWPTAGGIPTSEFRPLHEINPLRLEWINARAPLAGKNVIDIGCGGGILSESMARKGANVTGIDLSEKALKVADLHSLESGVEVRYELISAEDMAAREAGTVRRRHLHGNAGARAGSGRRSCAPAPRWSSRAATCSSRRSTAIPKSYLFAVIGAEYVLRMLPKGTHDYAKFITPAELSQFVRDAGLDARRHQGHDLQPADQDLFAEPGHRASTTWSPARRPLSMIHALANQALLPDPDARHRVPSCSTSTARWPTPRPTWPPPSTGCAPSAAWSRRPTNMLRPTASAGARGMIGAAFGLAPGDDGYEELRAALPRQLPAAMAVHSRAVRRRRRTAGAVCDERGMHWGIVTNKAARFTDPLVPQIGLEHAGCVVSGDTTPHPKPHPAPLLEAARRLGLAPEHCWYVGDDLRDIQAGRAAGMVDRRRRLGLLRRRRSDRPVECGCTGRSPSNCCNLLATIS